MIKAIIVDDQLFCVEMLQDLLHDHCSNTIEVVATSHSGQEALQKISKFKPDVVFLDIEMPEMTGFEMLKQITPRNFEVIFTTSYDKYMVDAMRHSAFDYLMKPINPVELKAAVDRIIKQNGSKQLPTGQIDDLISNLKLSKNRFNKIALPSMDGFELLGIDQILQCESESNYTTIYLTSGEKIVVTKTLSEIEELIDSNEFFRIHRSHLVNLNHIKRYAKGGSSGGGHIVLSDNTMVLVARNRKEEFIDHFSKL
jgi:two-component system LytT family response regulator